MAVELITANKHFVGLAADTKPTDAAAGSTFFESDTGLTYIWYSSAWVVK